VKLWNHSAGEAGENFGITQPERLVNVADVVRRSLPTGFASSPRAANQHSSCIWHGGPANSLCEPIRGPTMVEL
jgi:hypothetical protein